MKLTFREVKQGMNFEYDGGMYQKIIPYDKFNCVNRLTGELNHCEDDALVDCGEPLGVKLEHMPVGKRFLAQWPDGLYYPVTRMAVGVGAEDDHAIVVDSKGTAHRMMLTDHVYLQDSVPDQLIRP